MHALYDLNSEKVYLFRDEFGEKPLYYTLNKLDKTFSFSSTLESLLTVNEWNLLPSEISQEATQKYLNFGYTFQDTSIIDGIKKVKPGTILEYCLITDQITGINEFDFVNPKIHNFNVIDNEIPEKVFRNFFEEAVASTLTADVPVGSFLSGGIDSTLVTAVANKILPNNKSIKTFSIGFYDDVFDESTYSNKAADILGTDHTLKMFSDDEILEYIPQISSNFCEPFADSSCLPTMMVSKLASENVTVCLTGDDCRCELFGGYGRYRHANALRLKYRFGKFDYRNLLPMIDLYCYIANSLKINHNAFILKLNKLRKLLGTNDAEEFYLQFLTRRTGVNLEQYLTGRNQNISCNDVEFYDLMREVDFRIYLEGDILTKVDRSAMAFSLETRAPFLNQNICQFAKKHSINFNIKHSVDKYFPRKLLLEYMPGDFFDRPKKGFGVPLQRWLKGPLNNWMNTLIADYAYYLPKLEQTEIREMASSLERGNDLLAPRIWTYLMFIEWCKNEFKE